MEDFDFEEASRRMEKNVTLVYYDHYHTYRNFVIKLRDCLEDYSIKKEDFRSKVDILEADLKRAEKELMTKHFSLYQKSNPCK